MHQGRLGRQKQPLQHWQPQQSRLDQHQQCWQLSHHQHLQQPPSPDRIQAAYRGQGQPLLVQVQLASSKMSLYLLHQQ
jgi:hypothetical protein